MEDAGKHGDTQSNVNPASFSKPVFKRILLKLSGEALEGDQGYGLDSKTLDSIAKQVKSVHDLGVEIALVVAAAPWRKMAWTVRLAITWECWPP